MRATADEIAEGVVAITRRLRRFAPHIEPSQDHPGVFWLDASGLQPLFASLESWAHNVQRYLRRSDFHGRVVVGFTRFGPYATPKAGQGRRHPDHVTVFRNAAAEQQAVVDA